MHPKTNEIARIRSEYRHRDKRLSGSDIYSPFNPAQLFAMQGRQRATLSLLNKLDIISLAGRQILEVGCGHGSVLFEYLGYNASPNSLFGCDLIFERLRNSNINHIGLQITCADGQHLPFPDETFDLVVQYTLFSSILDVKVKRFLADEMVRIMKKDGIILWYDFWLNPTNPQTRGIRPDEIRQLFPNKRYLFNRITLAPPITRHLIGTSWTVCLLLESLKIFNSHYLVAILP